MRRISAIWLAALVLPACVSVTAHEYPARAPVSAPVLDNAEAWAIVEERNTYYEALISAQDVDGLIALHTADAMILRPGTNNVQGEAAHRTYWQEAFDYMDGLKVSEKEVFFAGPDTIISRDTYETFSDGKKLSQGQSVIIWKRVDGEWLVHWEMFN